VLAAVRKRGILAVGPRFLAGEYRLREELVVSVGDVVLVAVFELVVGEVK
jgi:hypothetical protein